MDMNDHNKVQTWPEKKNDQASVPVSEYYVSVCVDWTQSSNSGEVPHMYEVAYDGSSL